MNASAENWCAALQVHRLMVVAKTAIREGNLEAAVRARVELGALRDQLAKKEHETMLDQIGQVLRSENARRLEGDPTGETRRLEGDPTKP